MYKVSVQTIFIAALVAFILFIITSLSTYESVGEVVISSHDIYSYAPFNERIELFTGTDFYNVEARGNTAKLILCLDSEPFDITIYTQHNLFGFTRYVAIVE